jgi:hypothetical protein
MPPGVTIYNHIIQTHEMLMTTSLLSLLCHYLPTYLDKQNI